MKLKLLVDVSVGRKTEQYKGVLLLRLEDQTGKAKVGVLSEIFKLHSEELEGHFSVYQNGRLRIRK